MKMVFAPFSAIPHELENIFPEVHTMTNCRKKMPIVPLNLYNFESSIVSAGCPYVLTSPRSLRACKRAGVKPVDLMYQSSSEIADNLGVHPKYVTDLFVQKESDRQRKLELCRKIRNDIIADESLIRSLDLAHKDKLDRDNTIFESCLSTCARGNRTPTSLRRRHYSSLLDHHHLKGLTEDANHGSSPSVRSNFSSRSTVPPEPVQSPSCNLKSSSPTSKSKSTECIPSTKSAKNEVNLVKQNSGADPSLHLSFQRSISKHKSFPVDSTSGSTSPTPRMKKGELSASMPRLKSSPSTPRTKSALNISLAPLASTSSTPDFWPQSTDTVSTPQSKHSVCPQIIYKDSIPTKCSRPVSRSPIDIRNNAQSISDFLFQSKKKCLKKRKSKVHKNNPDSKNDSQEEIRSKQVAFQDSLKRRKVVDSIKTKSQSDSNESSNSKCTNKKWRSRSSLKDSDDLSSSKSSFNKRSTILSSSDKDCKQTGVFKPRRKINEHRKSKYGTDRKKKTQLTGKSSNSCASCIIGLPEEESEEKDYPLAPAVNKKSIPKHSFFSSLKMNSMNISNHDLRILESLALKKEQEQANEELAYQTQLRWEEDRMEKQKFEIEQRNKWQKYIQEKRQLEKNIKRLEMDEIKLSLQKSERLFEENLKLRDEKVKKMLQDKENKRILEALAKQEQSQYKKSQIYANQQQRETLDAMKKFHHMEKIDHKLEQAKINREQQKDSIYKKIFYGNKMKNLKHISRMEELFANEAITRKQKLEECHKREQRAWQRYTSQVNSRLQQLKINSALRELRSDQVRSLARELDQGLEQWQDQVLLLQWQAMQKAEMKASIQMRAKKQRTESENKERQLQHADRLKRIRAIEAEKERGLQEVIEAKESRMRALQLRKEREILECRSAAYSTAELREHLRESLTPETFDRKVTKVAVEMRLGNRPSTASPTMMRSHIRLG